MRGRSGAETAAARRARGWSSADLAEAAGVSLVALERFEAGRAALFPAEVDRVERILARIELPEEPIRWRRRRPSPGQRR